MNRQKLTRFAILGLVAFVALGVAGMALKDDGNSFEESALGGSSFSEESGRDLAPAAGVGVGESKGSTGSDGDDSVAQTAPAPTSPLAVPAADADAGGAVGELPYSNTNLASTADRQIIQTASMKLEVENVGESFEEVGRIASGAGGFVSSSNSTYQGEAQFASISVRVPSDRYQSVLGSLRGLGTKVISESSEASDVTEEFTDLNSRLRNLEATETQLLTLLGQAEDISDILLVQDRLNGVRSQIEQIQGRINLLGDLSDLATISVHLQPGIAARADNGDTNIGDEVSEAWDNSIEFLTDIAAGAVHVIVFAWWVPIIALPVLFVGSRVMRRQRALEALD